MDQQTVRKTFKETLRPTSVQARVLDEVLWHCRTLYNAALEQRITAWQRCHVSICRFEQEAELKAIRAEFPEYRCSRFGVAYIQTLLSTQGRELVIINEAEDNEAKDGQDDLLQDFVAIITAFCARLYGRRRANRKKTQLLAVLEVN
jgi:hypothetical protein